MKREQRKQRLWEIIIAIYVPFGVALVLRGLNEFIRNVFLAAAAIVMWLLAMVSLVVCVVIDRKAKKKM